MKKLFLALMCAGALLFTGCNKDNDPELKSLDQCDNTIEKCWETTYRIGFVSETEHMWGTEYMIVKAIKETQELNGGLGTWTYKATDIFDEEACEELDD